MDSIIQPFQVVAYAEAAARIAVAIILSRALVVVGLAYVRARFNEGSNA